MTFDEIKDLINSTITENGTKSITGKTLNLALNELVSAVEEASANAGSRSERLYANIDMSSGQTTVTEEQKALNAALYEKLKTAFETDELIPNVGFQVYAEAEGTAMGQAFPSFLVVQYSPSENVIAFASSNGQFVLSSDGTVTMGS